jgi:hypothetical protein
VALDTTGTILALSGITLNNYSARQLTLQITPIDPGELAWDANGTLHDLTMTQFRKRKFTVSCTDTDAPVLDDVWKGKLVSITILPKSGFAAESDEEQQTFACMLSSWTVNNEEWPARVGWTLELLET